ncbi:hypothetical protein H6F89_11470 [Cyanobacteria bacterium FACHB-63]|nr:hypothetical protein [Cyanobacteria bacterium FACHB-63]
MKSKLNRSPHTARGTCPIDKRKEQGSPEKQPERFQRSRFSDTEADPLQFSSNQKAASEDGSLHQLSNHWSFLIVTKIKGFTVLVLLIALVIASRWNATAKEMNAPARSLTTNSDANR